MEKPLNLEPIHFPKIRTAAWLASLGWLSLIAYWHRNVVMDDPWITFRYARNLVEGRGLVFNEGEWVEGFSNPSWVLLSAAGHFFRVEPLGFAQALSWLSLAALTALLTFGWDWRSDRESFGTPFRSAWGALILASCFPVAVWTPGGLETIFYTLLMTLFTLTAGSAWARPSPLLTAAASAALTVAVWTRPEAFLWLAIPAAMVGYDLWQRRPLWPALVILVSGTAGWILQLAIRWILYGELLPNSVAAKTGGGIIETAGAGLIYMAGYFLGGAAVLLALAAWGAIHGLWTTPQRWQREQQFLAVVSASALMHFAFILATGGDWMPGYRFIAPVLPLLALLAALAIYPYPTFVKSVAAGFLLSASLIQARNDPALRWCRWAAKEQEGTLLLAPLIQTGRWLENHTEPGALLAGSEAGVIPYYAERPFIDMLGLMEPEIAKLPGGLHKKFNADYVLGREPDYFVLGTTVTPAGEVGTWEPDREILAHPEFQENYRLFHRIPRLMNDAEFERLNQGWSVIYRRIEPLR